MRDYVLNEAYRRDQAELFPALRRRWANWRNRQRLRNVAELDDFALKDIGLSRSDVGYVLRLPLDQDPVAALNRLAGRADRP